MGQIKFSAVSLLKTLFIYLLNFRRCNEKRIDFMIIGAQKSGTSALNKYLRMHPDIGLPRNKELHFFNNDSFFFLPNRIIYTHYHRFFPDIYEKLKTFGEATPNYMVEKRYIDRIHSYNPALKLIVIFRDPVSRAHSHWNMERERGLESRSFEETVDEMLDQTGSDHYFAYFTRGEYARQLSYVFTKFPRRQVLILFQEVLLTDPSKTLHQVSDFLHISEFNHAPPMDVHSHKYDVPMSESVKVRLKSHYLPHIEALERLIDVNLCHWK
jgi:hypothetical protein